MDFVITLSKTPQGCDAIWVIMDRLAKFAHFLHIKISYSTDKLA